MYPPPQSWTANLLFVILALLAVFSPEPIIAQEISDIQGKWNSDILYENIEIKDNGDVLDERFGQGRIATTQDHAANIVIYYRDATCWYRATLIDAGHLRLASRSGPNASNMCMIGGFTKIVPSPSNATTADVSSGPTEEMIELPAEPSSSVVGKLFVINSCSEKIIRLALHYRDIADHEWKTAGFFKDFEPGSTWPLQTDGRVIFAEGDSVYLFAESTGHLWRGTKENGDLLHSIEDQKYRFLKMNLGSQPDGSKKLDLSCE